MAQLHNMSRYVELAATTSRLSESDESDESDQSDQSDESSTNGANGANGAKRRLISQTQKTQKQTQKQETNFPKKTRNEDKEEDDDESLDNSESEDEDEEDIEEDSLAALKVRALHRSQAIERDALFVEAQAREIKRVAREEREAIKREKDAQRRNEERRAQIQQQKQQGQEQRQGRQGSVTQSVTPSAKTRSDSDSGSGSGSGSGHSRSQKLTSFFPRVALAPPLAPPPFAPPSASVSAASVSVSAAAASSASKTASETAPVSSVSSASSASSAVKPAQPTALASESQSESASAHSLAGNKRLRDKPDEKEKDQTHEAKQDKPRKTGNKRLSAESVPPKPPGFTPAFAPSAASSAAPFVDPSASSAPSAVGHARGKTKDAPNASGAPPAIRAAHVKDGGRPFRWRLTLTNAQSLLKFLSGIFRTIPRMRLFLERTDDFQGFRLFASNTTVTLVCNSAYSCAVEAGVDERGVPLSLEALNSEFFCVSSANFHMCLKCAAEKDTNLTITQYNSTTSKSSASDKLTFEAVADTGASFASFECPTEIADGPQPSRIPKEVANDDTSFVEMTLQMLKGLCAHARYVTASSMSFKVDVCQDPHDADVFHQRISIGFSGHVSGERVFLTSTRQLQPQHRGDCVEESFEPVQVHKSVYDTLPWVQESHNEFSTKDVALFLRNMEGEWVQIKLGADSPLVLTVKTADSSTEHKIMVAALEEDP